MRIYLETFDLLRFVNRLEQMPERLADAGVEALNETGDATRREVVEKIVDDTQFPESVVERFVEVQRASRNSPQYEIRVREALLDDEMRQMAGRGWEARERGPFEGMLMNVITAGDDAVCPICERIAEEGPYAIEEVRQIEAHHPHFLSRDLNCRCQLSPALSFSRRLPVRMRESRGTVLDINMTLKQLADKVIEKSRIVMRIK